MTTTTIATTELLKQLSQKRYKINNALDIIILYTHIYLISLLQRSDQFNNTITISPYDNTTQQPLVDVPQTYLTSPNIVFFRYLLSLKTVTSTQSEPIKLVCKFGKKQNDTIDFNLRYTLPNVEDTVSKSCTLPGLSSKSYDHMTSTEQIDVNDDVMLATFDKINTLLRPLIDAIGTSVFSTVITSPVDLPQSPQLPQSSHSRLQVVPSCAATSQSQPTTSHIPIMTATNDTPFSQPHPQAILTQIQNSITVPPTENDSLILRPFGSASSHPPATNVISPTLQEMNDTQRPIPSHRPNNAFQPPLVDPTGPLAISDRGVISSPTPFASNDPFQGGSLMGPNQVQRMQHHPQRSGSGPINGPRYDPIGPFFGEPDNDHLRPPMGNNDGFIRNPRPNQQPARHGPRGTGPNPNDPFNPGGFGGFY